MIVCPHCRNVNDEDAASCASCGRSLEPGPAAMRGVRREPGPVVDDDDDDDVAPRPKRRFWPGIAILAAVLVVAGAVALYFAMRPDACRGKARSERFSGAYCVDLPEGWEQQPAMIGDQVQVDEYYDPAGVATVHVVAFDLPDGTTLEDFAAATRQTDLDADLEPGPIKPTTLGDVAARTWDITKENPVGDVFRIREVVAVVDGQVGWTIEMSDTADGFRRNLPTFESMLSSWHFE